MADLRVSHNFHTKVQVQRSVQCLPPIPRAANMHINKIHTCQTAAVTTLRVSMIHLPSTMPASLYGTSVLLRLSSQLSGFPALVSLQQSVLSALHDSAPLRLPGSARRYNTTGQHRCPAASRNLPGMRHSTTTEFSLCSPQLDLT